MARRSFSVYAIELDPAVLREGRFRTRNPDHNPWRPCVYVGSTFHPPELRFEQHKRGIRANRFATRYGLKLLPDLVAAYNPIPSRKEAEDLEAYLADRLRKKGYAVWQG